MTELTVDRGFPVPSPNTSKTRFPWNTMVHGDSFLVPTRTACKSAISSFAHYKRTQERAGRVVPFRLVTRSMGQGQHRIWLMHVED